jgi:hypothetical protein
MATRCRLCSLNLKPGTGAARWFNPTDDTTYTVHKNCLDWHKRMSNAIGRQAFRPSRNRKANS